MRACRMRSLLGVLTMTHHLTVVIPLAPVMIRTVAPVALWTDALSASIRSIG